MTQQQAATLEAESTTPGRTGGEAAVMPGYGRLRERLAGACAPCPQREGALRREWLCRCPVALCVRLLQRVERGGPDPGTLAPWEMAALRLQDRLAPAEMSGPDPEALAAARQFGEALSHGACGRTGCLACWALRRVRGTR